MFKGNGSDDYGILCLSNGVTVNWWSIFEYIFYNNFLIYTSCNCCEPLSSLSLTCLIVSETCDVLWGGGIFIVD